MNFRSGADNAFERQERPLVLFGHSFGGTIIAQVRLEGLFEYNSYFCRGVLILGVGTAKRENRVSEAGTEQVSWQCVCRLFLRCPTSRIEDD
jgi:hypothetical protein